MSLFYKDPKSCMNPWQGLAVIVAVCCFVMVTLSIARWKHLSFGDQYQQPVESQAAVSPTVY